VVVVCPVSLLLLHDDVWVVVVDVVHWALLPLPPVEPPAGVAVVVVPQSFVLSASADPDGTANANATSTPTAAALLLLLSMVLPPPSVVNKQAAFHRAHVATTGEPRHLTRSILDVKNPLAYGKWRRSNYLFERPGIPYT
jgi:hypothetical protein